MSTPYSISFTALTFNVHLFGAIGADVDSVSSLQLSYQDSDRTTALIAFLNQCKADVIGLQEVWDTSLAEQIQEGVSANYMSIVADDLPLDTGALGTLLTHPISVPNGVGCGLMLLASRNSVAAIGHIHSDPFPINRVPNGTVDVQDAFALKGYLKAQLHMKTGDLRIGVIVSHMITNLSSYSSSGAQCFRAIQERILSFQSESGSSPLFLLADLNVNGESYDGSSWGPSANYSQFVQHYLIQHKENPLLADVWRDLNPDMTSAPGYTSDETINTLYTMFQDEDNTGDSASQKRIDYIMAAGGAAADGAAVDTSSATVLNSATRPQYLDIVTGTERDLSDHFALTATFQVSWSS